MHTTARRLAVGVALGALSVAGPAGAQIDARALIHAVTHPRLVGGGGHSRERVPEIYCAPGSERVSVVVEVPPGELVASGWRQVAPGFAAAEVDAAELDAMAPELRVSWAPARQLQLDRADGWTRASLFRNRTQSGGAGAIVGVVDTGIDASHPDLRHPDGRTRVAWYIDFAREPAGRHPELEDEYGCTGNPDFRCAVFSGEDIDAFLESPGSLDEPRDTSGHGTHVASLAAGNGLGSPSEQFVGTAPEATLIVARATRGPTTTILDGDALLATRFIFDRAAEMGLPAVVNLSLGTDFGAHDGSSVLGRGLAAFLGPDEPGRAIVVAAGNSGTLYAGRTGRYPEPLGIHTEVHVPHNSTARVPLLTPATGASATRGALYVWVTARPGDSLSVGVDDAGGRWIDPVAPGGTLTHQDGDLEVTILNAAGDHGGSPVAPNHAIVVIDGAWPSGETFAIRFEGHGTPRLWVQSEGDLSPATGSMGAVFPRGKQAGTINIPATHPALIAVGATVNRDHWMDRSGGAVQLDSYSLHEDWTPGSAAYFSAAGPTATGTLKPDLVAPGAYVAGAMSGLADPARNDMTTIFFDPGICTERFDCLVLDDGHALNTGTSMAAPLVAGAAALLLAREPDLTQARVRALLQAGVRWTGGGDPSPQQLGPGALDLDRTLDAQLIATADTPPSIQMPAPDASWLALSDEYVHPDTNWVLHGLAVLRAADGSIAHGFDADRLHLEVAPGRVVLPLAREAPGLWRFAVAAPAGSGGEPLHLTIRLDDEVLLSRRVPIAVDPWVLEEGAAARGGCSLSSGTAAGSHQWWLLLFALLCAQRRRRAYNFAR